MGRIQRRAREGLDQRNARPTGAGGRLGRRLRKSGAHVQRERRAGVGRVTRLGRMGQGRTGAGTRRAGPVRSGSVPADVANNAANTNRATVQLGLDVRFIGGGCYRDGTYTNQQT